MVGLHYHNFMRVRHTPSHLFLHTYTHILYKHNVGIYTRARARFTDRSYPDVSSSKPFQNDRYARIFFFKFVWPYNYNITVKAF